MSGPTVNERLERINNRIAALEVKLEELRAAREKLQHPTSMRAVFTAAKNAGFTPQEIADLLGLEI